MGDLTKVKELNFAPDGVDLNRRLGVKTSGAGSDLGANVVVADAHQRGKQQQDAQEKYLSRHGPEHDAHYTQIDGHWTDFGSNLSLKLQAR